MNGTDESRNPLKIVRTLNVILLIGINKEHTQKRRKMHYYQFNIGDYAKATRHLSNLEDLAYRRLMEFYYDTEKPLIKDIPKLSRLINMRDNQEEIKAVLEDFFIDDEDGYKQNRIEKEIKFYKSRADVARVNGKKGGRPKKPINNPVGFENKPNPNPDKTGSKANQQPTTINQQPETKKQVKKTCPENQDIEEIVHFLNLTCSTNFRSKTDKTKNLIKTRLSENWNVQDFKTVILKKFNEWVNTEHEKFLRPETLFGNKFEGYLNQKEIGQKKEMSSFESMSQKIKDSQGETFKQISQG